MVSVVKDNNYQQKIISIEEGLELIKDNDSIISGMGPSEPRLFLSEMHKISDKVKNVRIATCLPFLQGEYLTNPKHNPSFFSDMYFSTGVNRSAAAMGIGSYTPNHLHQIVQTKLARNKPNILICAGSMPDKHGYISLLSAVYELDMAKVCDKVIVEINPNFPRTLGENIIHISRINYIIETDYKVPIIPRAKATTEDKSIAEHICELIEDGSCIQLGIGGTPAAVAEKLKEKRRLGIHTEMFTSEMVDLIESGAVDGSQKNVDTDFHVCSFAAGDEVLYKFLDDNPSVIFRRTAKTISPHIIAQNDNQISINTAMAVDLTGQVSSESIGTKHYSGTGGQSDTVRGAVMSKGGKSFIALKSIAEIKNRDTGEIKTVSKIVPTLEEGSVVSLQRNDVQYVVTEYGAVNLQGASIDQRARMLISIAHPMFREELEKAAKKHCFIF